MTHPTNPAPVATSKAIEVTEVVLPGVVEPDGLQLRTHHLAAPRKGRAVVAVEATGISMAEQQMRRGRYPGQPTFPFVPGYDLVGTVTATGPGVDPALVGRRVAAITKTGGWTTHAALLAEDLVVVPRELDPAEVETLVVNALPNGKRASFYYLWSGHTVRPARFRKRTREAIDAVLGLLADGTLTPQVAGTFPLTQVREAMALAESRTVRGKVVLLP